MNKIEEALEPFAAIGRKIIEAQRQGCRTVTLPQYIGMDDVTAESFCQAARVLDGRKKDDDQLQLKKWGQLREVVAELIGEDPRTWPDHGNASVAIAASVALMVNREKRIRELLEDTADDALARIARLREIMR